MKLAQKLAKKLLKGKKVASETFESHDRALYFMVQDILEAKNRILIPRPDGYVADRL